MQSFSELGVPARIVRGLTERDIHTPFPIQEHVLRDALAGRDVLAKAPTGSGKTLAFAIPLVERLDLGDARPSALVLVPTRELASQVAVEVASLAPEGRRGRDRLRRRSGARAGEARAARARPRRDARPPERPARAEGRLARPRGDPRARRGRPDARHGLQAQVDRIVRRLPRARQTMFFSATLDARVGELARAYTSNPVTLRGCSHSPTKGARSSTGSSR